jgi:hypothetical protein
MPHEDVIPSGRSRIVPTQYDEKHMDPGAVAMVIRCIERAEILQEGVEDADQGS